MLRKFSIILFFTPLLSFSETISDQFGVGANAFTIQFVSVGNTENTSDTTGYGAVNYAYKIGKYEITVSQYVKFLNAKAKSNNSLIWDDSYSAINFIERSGVNGAYVYSIRWNGEQRPMCQVSWFDVARYCNWLHNGAREESSMENGAYNLNGTNERVVGKNNNAEYWVPTENEWYKAAYYDPEKNKAFGGGGGYYSFATRSSAISTDIATYARRSNIYTQNIPYTGTTLVGTYANYPSYYGTFDQTGNVGEWTDGEILLLGQTQKVERGGWWTNEYENVQSKLGRFGYDPSTRNDYFGIRLAN